MCSYPFKYPTFQPFLIFNPPFRVHIQSPLFRGHRFLPGHSWPWRQVDACYHLEPWLLLVVDVHVQDVAGDHLGDVGFVATGVGVHAIVQHVVHEVVGDFGEAA